MNKPGKTPVPQIALAACGLVFSVTGLAPVAVTAQDGAAPAFTIEGEVLDAATGVPVEAAIVTVIGLSASDVSNELGYFHLEEIPAGSYAIRVLRLGYQTLEEGVSIEGEEVLTIHLTPGPVPLRGIEVEVITRGDYDLRSVGIASHGLIAPAEMEDLRQRYMSLHQVLRTRRLPRARYHPPMIPGQTGCLRLTAGSLSSAGVIGAWGPRSRRGWRCVRTSAVAPRWYWTGCGWVSRGGGPTTCTRRTSNRCASSTGRKRRCNTVTAARTVYS